MKVILYTIVAFILDIMIWGTLYFVLFNLTSFFDDSTITVWHYLAAIFFYTFIEGLRLQLAYIYDYMKA